LEQRAEGHRAERHRNDAPRREGQRDRNGRPHHPEPAAAAHHDDIASVGFLRRKPREDAPAQA
jgi:hypothetical protein